MARQAGKPSLCASVRAVPWADEAEQQLCQLALSGCELSADVRTLGAGLPETPGTDSERHVGILRWQDKQAAPGSFASVRAVPWADEAEQQLFRLGLWM